MTPSSTLIQRPTPGAEPGLKFPSAAAAERGPEHYAFVSELVKSAHEEWRTHQSEIRARQESFRTYKMAKFEAAEAEWLAMRSKHKQKVNAMGGQQSWFRYSYAGDDNEASEAHWVKDRLRNAKHKHGRRRRELEEMRKRQEGREGPVAKEDCEHLEYWATRKRRRAKTCYSYDAEIGGEINHFLCPSCGLLACKKCMHVCHHTWRVALRRRNAIKKAYRVLALKEHPDKNGSTPEAHARFQRIKNAYEKLIAPRPMAPQLNLWAEMKARQRANEEFRKKQKARASQRAGPFVYGQPVTDVPPNPLAATTEPPEEEEAEKLRTQVTDTMEGLEGDLRWYQKEDKGISHSKWDPVRNFEEKWGKFDFIDELLGKTLREKIARDEAIAGRIVACYEAKAAERKACQDAFARFRDSPDSAPMVSGKRYEKLKAKWLALRKEHLARAGGKESSWRYQSYDDDDANDEDPDPNEKLKQAGAKRLRQQKRRRKNAASIREAVATGQRPPRVWRSATLRTLGPLQEQGCGAVQQLPG
ncbi:hypothetical protein OQA88_13486 [Cercophora sp. LCS_1]